MNVSICVSVQSVRQHISRTAGPIFAKFSEHVAYGRGSVLFWRRCDTL